MSGGPGGRDDEGPEDDPFAFAPDDHDARPGGSAAGDPAAEPDAPTPEDGARADADDPFAFPPDEAGVERPGEGAPDAERSAAGGPPARRGRRGRKGTVARRPLDDAETERVRTVADEAAAHARAVGARWLAVALAVLVALVVITTVTGGPDRDGGDVAAGERLPDFAAPLVSAPRPADDREDVNLATKDGQGDAGEVAACSIRNPAVVTSCGLLARGPLVLVVFSRGVDSCVRAIDELDAARRRHPGLQALAVSLLGDHGSTGETARDRRWTLPVAYDHDGALGQALGAPACPLVLFVARDGTVRQRIIGSLDPAALEAGIRRLLAPATPAAPATSTVSAAPTATTVDATAPGR